MLAGTRPLARGRNVYRIAGLLLALASCGAARAEEPMAPGYPDDFYALDAREVRLLPPYCIHGQYFRDKYGRNDVERERWEAALGPTFWHVHHYCFGLLKTNRALLLTRTKQYREFYLRDSIVEFDYVIDRAPADFVLLPEILTKKGENLVRIGRGEFAVIAFERATELNPSFWPPYAQLADYYKGQGQNDKAREVLKSGLAHSPDAQALQRRLNELGPTPARPVN
jgi:tetratricopeptide (TPR) repeat protein